jgi:hypothetical protein
MRRSEKGMCRRKNRVEPSASRIEIDRGDEGSPREEPMHNWIELHMLARDKVTEAVRSAEEGRRGEAAAARQADRRPASLILAQGEVLRIRIRRGTLRVTCRTGRVWATSDREKTDNLLAPAESVTYGERGTVVVEALRTAALRLEYREAMTVERGAPLRAALQVG